MYSGVTWEGLETNLISQSEAPTDVMWEGHETMVAWKYAENANAPTVDPIFFGMNF